MTSTYSVAQTSEKTGIPQTTLYKIIREGKELDGVRMIRAARRFVAADVDALEARHETR